ncbi:hypothetical protein L0128_11745 [candidate division KSB1 bacterium]|nr:hypothetical protein [candidate division KSB1 bacterium]
MNRKVTPKVKNGKVQKKNRHTPTPSYWNTRMREIIIDKQRPGVGCKHVVRKKDILAFIELLPEWDELSKDINAIVLSEAEWSCDGMYSSRGVIQICAWPKDLWITCHPEYFRDHKDIFDRLGLEYEVVGDEFLCKFTERQVKAYQLLHIFLHELGHHHDRITTKSQLHVSRGENYAEKYARKYEQIIWKEYFNRF